MGSRPTRRKLLATVAVLAALALGAATLQAAVGWQPASAAPQVEASAGGSMALTDSEQEGAIFTIANLGPGDTGEGDVAIANSGSIPGTLALAAADLGDVPGRFGGKLSDRLLLRLEDVSSGLPEQVYSGGLAAMPELQLGTLAPGEARTYRFLVTLLDGGSPSSPFVDDNVYQRASTGVGYEWTLTEAEGEGEGPEPPIDPPVQPPVPPPAPPVGDPPPTPPAEPGAPGPSTAAPSLTGTPRADRLVGSSADDVIDGRGGADRIYGNGGRDHLRGGAGADWLFGGPGADRLRGGAGADHLIGGPGPDLIFARGGGRDVVDCGGGRDLAHVDAGDRVRGCERTRG